MGTAYYTDNEGLPICPDCFPEYEQEQRMIWKLGQRILIEETGKGDQDRSAELRGALMRRCCYSNEAPAERR